MTPRAVLHIGPDISGTSVGGIASVIRTLVDTAPYPAAAVASWWGRSWRPISLLRGLCVVWRAPRDTLVHAHLSEGGSWIREAAFVAAARASRKPVAVTLHGAELGDWVAARTRRILVSAVLRLAHVVFTLHERDAHLATELCPRPVAVIANPVAGAVGEAAAPAPQTVVFLGEQSFRKGVDVLRAAWVRVVARRSDAQLIVAGPLRDLPPVTGPNVTNLGPVSPDQARQLVRRATAVVLPSRAEALPMVLLEAMSEGVPFVATDVAGIPRLASAGAGLTVRPRDVQALADALEQVLADPALRDRLGRDGREWWSQNSAPAAVHEALLAGYQLASSSASGRGRLRRRRSAEGAHQYERVSGVRRRAVRRLTSINNPWRSTRVWRSHRGRESGES